MRFALIALILALGATAAHASYGSLVEVEVVDRDTCQVATTYPHRGQYWIAGTPGHRYAVRLINRSPERVLAVMSVDGVNAVSGETASAHQTGYVLGPWQRMEVNGWSKSMTYVAAFEFTALSNSYAARTGRPDNVGVIGVAVFRERQPVYRRYGDAISRQKAEANDAPSEKSARRDADSAGAPAGQSRAAAPLAVHPQESLGTGHGQQEWSHARHVAFERDSSSPAEVIALRYDSQRNLIAMGVLPPPHRHRYRNRAPDPFPIGFVPDPY
jgi:hypothetical protein